MKLPYRDSPSQRPQASLGFRESNIPTNITRPCFWEHAKRDSKKARLVKFCYLRPAGYSWYEHAKGGLSLEGLSNFNFGDPRAPRGLVLPVIAASALGVAANEGRLVLVEGH